MCVYVCVCLREERNDCVVVVCSVITACVSKMRVYIATLNGSRVIM